MMAASCSGAYSCRARLAPSAASSLKLIKASLAVLLGHQGKMIAFSFERVVGFFPLTQSKDGAINPAFDSFVSAVIKHDEQHYHLIDALKLIDLAEEALVVV